MAFDRAKFFASVRTTLFGGSLTSEQVAGMTAILDGAPANLGLDALAYCLATPFHETGRAMVPVMETQGVGKPRPTVDEAIARLERAWKDGKMPWVKTAYWRKDADGLSWLGRGLPQTTHKANYLKFEKLLGVPFTKDPELMLVPEHAVRVMFEGMVRGMFTGKKLADYFGPGRSDPEGARRIINGTESAAKVAGYHRSFAAALRAAGYASGARSEPVPAAKSESRKQSVAPPAPPPLTPVNTAPAKPAPSGFFSAVRGWFGRTA